MFHRLLHLFQKQSQKKSSRPAARRRLELECLEARQVPTVTYHGGALLPHVEVEALYLGSDWDTGTYVNLHRNLDTFLGVVTTGSYMDMLTNAGYNVGRGLDIPGVTMPVTLNKKKELLDSQIQSAVQAEINRGALRSPDANRLYVVYVEDNVAVNLHGFTSKKDFLGYHGAFAGRNSVGQPADIRYAVIIYPGGTVGNLQNSWLSTFDGLTLATSHEMVEAATDPDVNYKTLGWYDNVSGEIGDGVAGQTIYFHNYAVQRIADRNDQAMTPAGAESALRETFILYTNGGLWELSPGGRTGLAGTVVTVSDQGIDNHGQAMVDIVTTSGQAWEYHHGLGWVYLGAGITSAVAGQGVSYVLFSNGNLFEYRQQGGTWTAIGSGIASINAGTDWLGVNAVDVIDTGNNAWEYSDSSGWHFLASGVQSVSAGQQGVADLLYLTSDAVWHYDGTNQYVWLGNGVAMITTGVDTNGLYMIDLILTTGDLLEYRTSFGWFTVASQVQFISKARAGRLDLVLSTGDADEHNDAQGTWVFLGSSVLMVV
jgi:hypothetical protein